MHIAKNILRDKNKTALILAMQMDSLEKSRTQADSYDDKERAFSISTDLQNFDISFFGDMQFIMKLNMLSSESRFTLEYFNIIKKYNPDPVDKVLKILLEKYKVGAKLIYDSSPKTYFEDLFYGFVLYDLHDPINALSVLRSGITKLNEAPSKDSQNISSIKIFYLMMLLNLDKIDEKESFIKVEKYENPYFTVNYRARQLAYFDTLEAAMNVKRNQDEMAFSLLKDARLNDYPCVGQLLFDQLKGKNEFYSLMDVRYGNMEANGFRNFSLYNGWGAIKKETGKFQEAYEKYNTSLKYPGDKEWALLNWGWAAFDAQDYTQSIDKFRESLKTTLVPMAVYGLLNSLSANNDSKQYLIAYKQYFEVLTEIKDENRKIQFSQMAYAHQCRIKDSSGINLLVDSSRLGLESFDPRLCGWLPPSNAKNPTQAKLH